MQACFLDHLAQLHCIISLITTVIYVCIVCKVVYTYVHIHVSYTFVCAKNVCQNSSARYLWGYIRMHRLATGSVDWRVIEMPVHFMFVVLSSEKLSFAKHVYPIWFVKSSYIHNSFKNHQPFCCQFMCAIYSGSIIRMWIL